MRTGKLQLIQPSLKGTSIYYGEVVYEIEVENEHGFDDDEAVQMWFNEMADAIQEGVIKDSREDYHIIPMHIRGTHILKLSW